MGIVSSLRLTMAQMQEAPSRRPRRRGWRRLPAVRTRVLVVMVIAALVGAVALVFALRPAPSEPSYQATAPPLALPSGGASALPSSTPYTGDVPVRLEAPTVGIDLGLVEGDGVHVPMDLASHYPGTAEPGFGNAVYYAHAQPGMFQALYNLHLGDEIRVIRRDGTELVFHVSAFKKVRYDDRSVLDPTAFSELTLLTCTSYDPFTPRYIVIAT